jgi:hypothetical protein
MLETNHPPRVFRQVLMAWLCGTESDAAGRRRALSLSRVPRSRSATFSRHSCQQPSTRHAHLYWLGPGRRESGRGRWRERRRPGGPSPFIPSPRARRRRGEEDSQTQKESFPPFTTPHSITLVIDSCASPDPRART